MKRRWRELLLIGMTPLLLAAIWMDDQPSFKPYESPVLTPPMGSVPVTGREVVTRTSELANPVAPSSDSQEEGGRLFAANCVFCHGAAQPGPVGRKLAPPAPTLGRNLLSGLDDALLYKFITLGLGRMPPFANKLSPQERWDLVNYLRMRN